MLGTEVCHHTVLRALGISLGLSYFVCSHNFVFFQNLPLKYFFHIVFSKKVIKKRYVFIEVTIEKPLRQV